MPTDGDTVHSNPAEPTAAPIDFWQLVNEVVPAAARVRGWDARALAFVVMLGTGGTGTTGTDITFDPDDIADKLGISPRTVYNDLKLLLWSPENQDGVLEQTEKPTRGKNGQKGRRARYRLVRPAWARSESCAAVSADSAHDSDADLVQEDRVQDYEEKLHTIQPDKPNRVQPEPESCATSHAQPLHSSTSYGPTKTPPPTPSTVAESAAPQAQEEEARVVIKQLDASLSDPVLACMARVAAEDKSAGRTKHLEARLKTPYFAELHEQARKHLATEAAKATMCEHEVPNGSEVHGDDGTLRCPDCESAAHPYDGPPIDLARVRRQLASGLVR